MNNKNCIDYCCECGRPYDEDTLSDEEWKKDKEKWKKNINDYQKLAKEYYAEHPFEPYKQIRLIEDGLTLDKNMINDDE